MLYIMGIQKWFVLKKIINILNLFKVELLLKNGANPNCFTVKYKSTPLHLASFNGYLDCIKVIL